MQSLTNRESFFKAKKIIKDNKFKINDEEIYLLLISINNFKNYTELVLNFDKTISNPISFLKKLKEIGAGKPIQYVIGYEDFCGLRINVNKNTLIPRPETEELVNKIIKIINENNILHNNIGDVCTGSGCIALSLKNNFKDSKVYGSDKYIKTLNTAIKNKDALNLDVEFFKGSLLKPFIERKIKLDVLVSNPPYVENLNDIEKNVSENEPMHAVYIKNGTYFYENFFKVYENIMNEKFMMAFEINYDQETVLTKLIKKYFNEESISYKFEKDFYGKTRFLFIFRGYKYGNFNKK